MNNDFVAARPQTASAFTDDIQQAARLEQTDSSEVPGGVRACAVLFLDIVGYSKRSVSEQQSIKYALDRELRLALLGIPREEMIILDTGDGAAVTFLNDIERAYSVAVNLRKYLSTFVPRRPVFAIRTGINVGPVKVVIDINQHTNVLGDGINVAQRIMSFALPGQLLISSSYYDMMRMLKPEYERTFVRAGRRQDKHAREHLVYEACASEPSRSQSAARSLISERLRANRIIKSLGNWPRVLMLASVVVALSLFVVSWSANFPQAHKEDFTERQVENLGAIPTSGISSEMHVSTNGKAARASQSAFSRSLSTAASRQSAKVIRRFGRT